MSGGFSFNQYLILGRRTTDFSYRTRKMFPLVREAVASVLPVKRLRYIAFSHIEADECGSVNEWLAVAPQSSPLCGTVAALVSVNDLADGQHARLRMGRCLCLADIPYDGSTHPPAPRMGMWFPDRRTNKDIVVRWPFHARRCRVFPPSRNQIFWVPAKHSATRWIIFLTPNTPAICWKNWHPLDQKRLGVCTAVHGVATVRNYYVLLLMSYPNNPAWLTLRPESPVECSCPKLSTSIAKWTASYGTCYSFKKIAEWPE